MSAAFAGHRQQKKTEGKGPRLVNRQITVALMAAAFLMQNTTMIVRVTASYRAVELGYSVFWVGMLATAFSLLPLPLSIAIGSYIDRGNEAKAALIGALAAIFACTIVAINASTTTLFIAIPILGFSHLTVMIALQVVCAMDERPAKVAAMIGNFMVATAVGQGFGSFVVGAIGGNAAAPPTHLLFLAGLVSSVLLFVACLGLLPVKKAFSDKTNDSSISLRELYRTPGYLRLVFAAVFSSGAQDLTFVYMPLVGHAHGFSVEEVGYLLTTMAIASMLARLIFTRLHTRFGTWQLAAASLLANAVGYAGIGLPLPVAAMYPIVALVGFSSGIALTCTVAGSISIAPPQVRAQANSMRLGGNRVAFIIMPPAASLIAAISGIGSVFIVVGAVTAATSALIHAHQKRLSASADS
jgi:predicted MFS family arabinose efflux permease